ncbi:MAG: hypothetical protein DME97_14740 [Verrucomicrobia bacterium]|nr:MAG: hypothetical protein DME97_14740 [Verrucomicrobiota bacterium]
MALSALALFVTTGFPRVHTTFGGGSPILGIGIVTLCTALGILAQYIFYLKKSFSWLKMLSPLVISPIVVLPLLASIQKSGDLDTLQLISFAFLAFQNGFFWRSVMENAKPGP